MMMLALFFAVPLLQQNGRNYERKRTVDLIAGALEDYRLNHGDYPRDAAEGQAFKSENPEIDSRYYFRFSDKNAGHSYVTEIDEISIVYTHWCNRYGNGYAANDPIAGDDDTPTLYVIYTTLEPEKASKPNIYCVDNYDHHPYVPPAPHP
jgi:hypothetical protein